MQLMIVTMWEVTRCARGLATSNDGQWVVTEARYGPCLSCLRVSELNISVPCHITQPRFEWHSCVCNLFYGLVSGLGESKQSKARCFVSRGLNKLRLFLLYLVQIHLTNSCFWVSHIWDVHRQRISLQGCNMHIVSSLHLVTRKPQGCSSELDKKQWSNKALAYPGWAAGWWLGLVWLCSASPVSSSSSSSASLIILLSFLIVKPPCHTVYWCMEGACTGPQQDLICWQHFSVAD